MNSVSKLKIVLGYALLLAALLFSLLFVHKEVETLTSSDDENVQWTDSLLTLLREKEANTIRMLRALSAANDSMISTSEIEHIIAEQDTLVVQHRVQRRVITHRDTVMTRQKKKGFFKRLGEVFVPPKKDSSIQVKTSLEFAVDTVIDTYNPVDSLQQKIRAVAARKKAGSVVVHRQNKLLQRMDHALTARIDSLVKGYEQESLEQERRASEHRQSVRTRSVRTIGSVAVGAVLLAAFFLILIERDVTRSNRYKRELEEARKRAEDLLATREKLMLAITHDFKAPLGSIMGYADLLSRLTVDERQRFYLDNMKNSSEHLLKLVVDLLDFHRLDLQKAEVNRVTFDPSRLLDDVFVSFEPLTSAKGLTLSYECASVLKGSFISDPLRLRQILTNLLSNAIKFTDQGGISLKAGYEEQMLVVAISDTGKGMERSDCERIFQEFTRLPGAQGKEGFGLGLSIVRMLVQLLQGTIQVESELGQGSTFTVRVPIYPVTKDVSIASKKINAKKTVDMPEASVVSGKTLNKVLLIDDDRIQLTLTSSMLLQSGISSVSCMQLDELLNALREKTFDVLLTDVQMPAIHGFDLLKLLRASNIPQAKDIPVIAVTARSDMQREEFVRFGFAGCLHKPFTVSELLRELTGKEVPLEEKTVQQVTEKENVAFPLRYDFAALTAFSEDDPEAAQSILKSFAEETQKHLTRLQSGMQEKNVVELSAVSHKMIPLFTMIGASVLVSRLRRLEAARDLPFTEDLLDVAHQVAEEVKIVLEVLPK